MRENNSFKRVVLWIVCVFVVVVGAACSSADSDTPATEIADSVIAPAEDVSEQHELGQSVYTTHCAACHGPNGEGQFPDAPLEQDETGRFGAPPHDGSGHTWHHDDDLIIEIIRNGGMGNPEDFYPMPPLGEVLTDQQIEAVIAYIKTFWTEEQLRTQRQRTQAIRNQ